MSSTEGKDDISFQDAVKGLIAGDFSRLAPLFDGDRCRIIEWFEAGFFADEPKALAEALTCACFLGCTGVAEHLLVAGVDLSAGAHTGLNGFHWAANRGQLDVVRLLIQRGAPLETLNRYGGTVLGTAVWSAINEPRPDHIQIIETLLKAGARGDGPGYPTGNERVDRVLGQYLADRNENNHL
jgi:Ankyrin repeats (3 copies)